MKKNLVWNVYMHNFNRDTFDLYNIFNHGGCKNYFDKIFEKFKKSEDKEAFAEALRRELMYYFWSKCEYEMVITKKDNKIIMSPWVGKKEIELDVTNDKNFDWLGFYDYMKEKKWSKDGSIKIDVYDQVKFNWDKFVDYCWENR